MIIYSQKYYNKYNQIVKHYKELNLKKSKTLYTETHHIVPKSMGGSNDKENLVRVPARVHFLLHWMLYRIYKNSSMAFAWNCMSTRKTEQRYYSKSYQYSRILYSKLMSIARTGYVHSEEAKLKISMANTGRIRTDEQKRKISMANTGRIRTNESKHRMSIARLGKTSNMLGKTHSDATKKQLSLNRKGKPKPERTKEHRINLSVALTGRTLSAEHLANMINTQNNKPHIICPYCSKSGHFRIMPRWHFNNCKYKPLEHTNDSTRK